MLPREGWVGFGSSRSTERRGASGFAWRRESSTSLRPVSARSSRPRPSTRSSRSASSWEDTRVDELVSGGADLVSLETAAAHLPFDVADYVDFYSSLEHATNLGRLFRPDAEPLRRTGATSRSATTGVRGSRGERNAGGASAGQTKPLSEDGPRHGPSRRLDIELELGFVVGVGSTLGGSVSTTAFREHVFGVVLVNDWSARDIQAWEYVPLGPFLGKSFATSIGAWITPLALLEDRFVAAPDQDPPPLSYLRVEGDWALDLDLEVELCGTRVSRTNARGLYWTMPQQLAHATANGASIRTGDLFASGTISGRSGVRGIAHRAVERRAPRAARRRHGADVPRRRRRGRAPRSRGRDQLAEVRGTVLPTPGGKVPAR